MSVTVLPSGTDIFSVDAHTIANPVNCMGVMGAGLARAFATRYPAHLEWYRHACAAGVISPGRPALDRSGTPWILAVPTKRHWREPSRLGDVDAALAAIARRAPGSGIESLALPALGCGLGGLAFVTVRERVHVHLDAIDVPVYLIAP